MTRGYCWVHDQDDCTDCQPIRQRLLEEFMEDTTN
jgi:hypothetical protein